MVEIPDFVVEHDKILEHRPLTDYGIEHDPLHLTDVPAVGYSLGRYENESGLLKIDGILKITCELFCCSQRLKRLLYLYSNSGLRCVMSG